MIAQRVERHIINSNHKYYPLFDHLCLLSKNLYNHANYVIRKSFFNEGIFIGYNKLDKILKSDDQYPDYKNMLVAQSAQQTLRSLENLWNTYFRAIKDWSINKGKYTGKPKIPSYKSKNSRYIYTLTNQQVKYKKDGLLHFPKFFNDFVIDSYVFKKQNFISLQQVRFIPRTNHIVIEIVYNIEIPISIENNNKFLSIDIGVDNLATVTNNFGEAPFIINGKGLKSINKYCNKKISYYKSVSSRMNKLFTTKRIAKLYHKRNNIMHDFMHKASRYIVNFAILNNVSYIIIGKNKLWKQSITMNKQNMQTFFELPFNKLIENIQYKGKEVGITVITTEESFTSGTSFLDDEFPEAKNYNKKRRIYRGLFVSNSGKKINSDVNGSLQILKKVFPNAYSNGIEAVAIQPSVVNIK